MKKNFRYIIGYLIGISLFGILIPLALIEISRLFDKYLSDHLIQNYYIRLYISSPFFLFGLLWGIWSNVVLFVLGKGGPTDGFNIAVSPRTEHLVVAGPYKYSRNPMAFGALIAYLGLGIFFNSIGCMAIIILSFFLVGFYLKKTEEKRLLKDFGTVYLEYKKRVPMLIPRPVKMNKQYIQQPV